MCDRTFGEIGSTRRGRPSRRGRPPLCDARLTTRESTMVLKTERCSFSGLRVYPGHGTRLTKIDSVRYMICVYEEGCRVSSSMEAFASHRTDEGRDGRDDDDDDACDDDVVGCDDDGAMREGGCACDSRARRVRRDGLEVHAWRDGARARWGRSRWRRWVRALTRASRGRRRRLFRLAY